MAKKSTTTDGKVKISINIDPLLLLKIDNDCEQKGLRRTDWLTLAAQWYLKKSENDLH